MRKALGLSSATTIAVGVVGAIGMMVIGWGVSGRAPYSIGFVSAPAIIGASTLVLAVLLPEIETQYR